MGAAECPSSGGGWLTPLPSRHKGASEQAGPGEKGRDKHARDAIPCKQAWEGGERET